jgi:tetratricopeptide (TPR) repeat protein
MRTMVQSLLILGCILAVFSPDDARAERALSRPTKQEARAHLAQGNRFYTRARWDDALREYKAGAEVEDLPVFDYNVAQALRMRGDYQESLLYYERFLDRGQPTGEVLEAVYAFIVEMRAHLANRARSMPPTEPAKVHDETPAVTPARGRNDEGSDSTAPNDARLSASTSSRLESSNWLGWTTTGVGAATIGVSGYLLFSAASLYDDSDAEPDKRKRDELRDGGRTRNLLGAVTGVSGLALTVTGAVLLLTHGNDSTQRAPAVSLGFTSRGFVVSGRF